MPEERRKPTGVLTSNSLPPFTQPGKSGDSTERRATRARSQHGHDPASLRRNTNGNHREHLQRPNTLTALPTGPFSAALSHTLMCFRHLLDSLRMEEVCH